MRVRAPDNATTPYARGPCYGYWSRFKRQEWPWTTKTEAVPVINKVDDANYTAVPATVNYLGTPGGMRAAPRFRCTISPMPLRRQSR